ncbi:protein PAXX [Cynoglossus semilaevis]|uniref:PAXX non-homologous end joining factor n=1 Tax=Cynoglossus semilaevis TaxID=244447 RepID=A0A3P8VFZ7_CYNSE|nr:protein PAXX [Cynoglossus semilaevis]
MEEDLTLYCTVADEKNKSRFICHTHRKHGVFSICLTDAVTLWRIEYTEEDFNKLRQKFNLKSSNDYIQKLRSASSSGKMSVLVHDTEAELQVGSRPGGLSMSLSRLEGPQAAEELRNLMFRMADSLTQLNYSKPSAISPVKNVQSPVKKHHTVFEPRQQKQNSMAVKRRPPGSSLINPGTKKKVQATGVAFDDADED